MRKITCVFAMLVMYVCGMFAATDFTARPELTTDEANPVVYAIVNYRGDCYSVKGDSLMSALKADGFSNPSVMTSEIDRSALWYFTDAGDGGLYIHSLEYSGGVATDLSATLDNLDNCDPYYIFNNEYSNGRGVVICIESDFNEDSRCCLDASLTAPILSPGWRPSQNDWAGTCWFFVKIDDPDDLSAAQKACDEAFDENHAVPPVPVQFIYRGLKYVAYNNGETCRLIGCADHSMTTLTIPEVAVNNGVSYRVVSIAGSAFENHTHFTGNLVIPDNIKDIGEAAFEGCRGFTGDLVIPDNIKDIGKAAFKDCTGFDGTLTLSKSLWRINDYVFQGCSGFTGDLVIPDNIINIGYSAFEGCSGFTGDLIIPNSVSVLNPYAFKNCSGFNGNLTLSSSLDWIGYQAFLSCSGFTGELIIPESVTEIGDFTFYDCPDFASRTCLAVVPPTLGMEVFDEGSVIYVPSQSLDKYKLNGRWRAYMLVPVDKKPTLNQTSAILNVGETLQLTATISGADAEVVWSSLNAEIASVSNTGLVTAKGAGKTAVLATTPDGFRTQCNITVIDPNGIDTVSDNNQVEITGRCIEAPAGSRVINLSGSEVGASDLAPGTYIVILPSSRTLKVVIK